MSDPEVSISQINIIAKQFDATVKFYRMLGLDIPEPMAQPPGALHAPARSGSGVLFEIDNEYLARMYNASLRSKSSTSSAIIGLAFHSREQVNFMYAKLVAAGYEGRQPPFDAFWGSRYAILADPEGNDVGLMSPAEDGFKSWPPVDSPAP